MHWRSDKKSEFSIQKGTQKRVKKHFNFRVNKKRSRIRSTPIVSDSYPLSHGGMLLVICMSIVVLLMSKGASVSPFFWHLSYDTHKPPSCCCCVMCYWFYLFISHRQVLYGFYKTSICCYIIFYGGKGRNVEPYYRESRRYVMGRSGVHQFQLALKLLGNNII